MELRLETVTPAGAPAPVPLEGVKARAVLSGGLARVAMAWRFRNAEKRPVEAVVKFPLPESAAVSGFRARIGTREVTGEVEEREAAFARYDDALAEGDGALLLDEERPNLFTLSLGNLEPDACALVELDFVTALERFGAETRFTLPCTITPRYLPPGAPDRDGRPAAEAVTPPYALHVPYGLSIEIEVAGAAGIAAVESPSHPVRAVFAGDAVTVAFAHGEAAMDRDFVLTVERKAAEAKFSARSAPCPGGGSVVALDLSLPEGEGKRAPREVLFLLDCSGSMAGSSIVQARDALAAFLRGLEVGDSFDIIRFGSSFERFFPAPRPYTDESLAAAVGRLAHTDADLGGTEALAPLSAALADPATPGRPRAIVLLTDGAVGDEDAILELARTHAAAARIFTVGIGHGPNEFFLRSLARSTGGACEMIAPGERIEKRVLRLFRKATADPAGTPRIEWGAAVDRTPAPDAVWPGEARTLFARFAGEPPESLRVEWALPGEGTIVESVRVAPDPAGSPIPALYAREAIRALEEGGGSGRGSAQSDRRASSARAALINLSCRFGVLCRETSFVAIERRTVGVKIKEEAVLRRVPCAITAGYGGLPAAAGAPTGAGRGTGLLSRLASFAPMIHGSTVPRPIMAAPAPPPPAKAKRRPKPVRLESAMDAEHFNNAFAAPLEMMPSEPALVTAPRRADAGGDDDLVGLLATQRAAGGFALPEERLAELGLARATLDAALAALSPALPPDEARALVVAAFVLALLAHRFAAERSVWDPVTAKSRRMVERSGATVGGVPIAAWAAGAVPRA